jgi:LysR family transcriptional regulator, low CO2-responsive transcriptional regulator
MTRNQIRRYFRHGTLTQLSTFEAIARHGSFTRAAEELCMAQPTVSVHIKKLTETVGMPLLKQVGKRIQLTDAGYELQTGCTEILQALWRFERKIARMRNIKSENLHVVAGSPALR